MTEAKVATPTLTIPEPEPLFPPGLAEEAWATGDATLATTCPNMVTHLLLPALLTKWHKKEAGLLQQPVLKDLLEAWEILVQQVDNTFEDYYNFIIQLSTHHKPFKGIHWKSGGHYMAIVT